MRAERLRLKTEQHRWSTKGAGPDWRPPHSPVWHRSSCSCSASSRLPADDAALDALQRIHPGVRILGCSTAGEIAGTSVLNDGGMATAIEFERTEVRTSVCGLASAESSRATGIKCARELVGPRLKYELSARCELHNQIMTITTLSES